MQQVRLRGSCLHLGHVYGGGVVAGIGGGAAVLRAGASTTSPMETLLISGRSLTCRTGACCCRVTWPCHDSCMQRFHCSNDASKQTAHKQAAEQPCMILDIRILGVGVGVGVGGGMGGKFSARLQQQALEAPVVGLPHGGGDAHVRGDARQHQVLHPPYPQQQLQVCARPATPHLAAVTNPQMTDSGTARAAESYSL